MRLRSMGVGVALVGALTACGRADSATPAVGGSGAAEAGGEDPPLRSELLVDGAWLQERLSSAGLVVLHVGSDESEFHRSHIPGARFIPISALNRERDGVPNMLPDRDELARVFGAAGVETGSHVVVYGAPLQAARAFVALEHIGHPRVSLLDGGAGSLASAGDRTQTAGGALDAGADGGVIVDARWVADRLDDPVVALIDARPRRQFTGEEAGDRVPRPGHIPGARNLFWEDLIVSTSEPRLRSVDDLRAMFRERGAAADREVVTYCRTGMQASFAYFVARYLGYEARMYDGSFVDWSPRAELPVQRGDGAAGE